MQERIVSNFKKCVTLKQQCDDMKGYQDLMSNNIEKLSLRLTAFNDNFTDKISKFTESFETKVKVIRETMSTESEGVAMQFEKTKGLCKELIDLNK